MKRKTVYNLFQINLIVLVTTSALMTPMILVFSYIIDFHNVMNEVDIILFSLVITAIFAISSSLYLVMTREQATRKVKVSYPKEFSLLLVVSSFGVLGIGILFIYLNGSISYVPNIVIPLFIFSYSVLIFAGERYFNVKVLRK